MKKKSSGPVRMGIVGLGRAGWHMHRAELQGKDNLIQVVAVCDVIEERCKTAAETWGCKAHATIDELIADPNVELVDIAHRSVDHCSTALKALKAGKHVQLEKPMCLTHAEAKRLQAAAQRGPGKLFIRHNRRFDPDFVHVREIVESGILGKVYNIQLTRAGYSRRDDWQALLKYGGGQLSNWGPHIIDHALRLMASPVKSIWSDLKRIAAAGDAEDYLHIVLKGENDCVADIKISGGSAIGTQPYLIWGTKGALSCDGGTITLRYIDPTKKLTPRKADPGTPRDFSFGSPDSLPWIDEKFPIAPKGVRNLWDEIYNTIRKGTRFPIKMEEAVEVMRVVSAAKKGTRFEFKTKKKR